MRNHFIFPYSGNKRTEVENIYASLNFEGIDTIIEPFAGTSALSYYINSQQPNKFRFILNDNSNYLYELYQCMKSPTLANSLEREINHLIDQFNRFTDDVNRKAWYKSIKDDSLAVYVFYNKYNSLRPSMYPRISRLDKIKQFQFSDSPISTFVSGENVDIQNRDAIDIISQYKDSSNVLMIIDPPYLLANNVLYQSPDSSVYEYFYRNKINSFPSYIVFILEDMWIIRLLFGDFIIKTYGKHYKCVKKRSTSHLIISNRAVIME